MPQLLSSCFDAVVGVAVVLAVPAAAFTHNTAVIAVAITAIALAVARVTIERRKARA
jgi:hypothetical protein